MPSKKRTVKYEENTEADGDRNVEVSDEVSATEDTGSEEHDTNSLTDQDDERYTPATGN